jgi:hypothetical protein
LAPPAALTAVGCSPDPAQAAGKAVIIGGPRLPPPRAMDRSTVQRSDNAPGSRLPSGASR